MRFKVSFRLLNAHKLQHFALEIHADYFIIILFVILKLFAKAKYLLSLLFAHLLCYLCE